MDFEQEWKVLRSCVECRNPDYGTLVTAGGIFGKMQTEIEQLHQENEKLKNIIMNHAYKYGCEFGVDLEDDVNEWKEKAEQYREALKGIADQPEVDEGSEDADGVANYCIEEAKEALEDSK